jgi:hypothetical protein
MKNSYFLQEGKRITLKFATFKFGDFRSLTFSDSHRFYTDEDAKTLEEIPNKNYIP